MQPKPGRPTGVTILGVLSILGGIALLVAGVALVGLGLVIGLTQAPPSQMLFQMLAIPG